MPTKKKRKTTKRKANALGSAVQKRLITVIFIFLIIVAAMQLGFVGNGIHICLRYIFGSFTGIFYLISLIYAIIYFIKLGLPELRSQEVFGLFLIFIGFMIITAIPNDHSIIGFNALKYYHTHSNSINGGLIGALLYMIFSFLVAYKGTLIACILIIIVGIFFLLANTVYNNKDDIIDYFKGKEMKKKTKKVEIEEEIEDEPIVAEVFKVEKEPVFYQEEMIEEPVQKVVEKNDVKEEIIKNDSNYTLPPMNLLNPPMQRKNTIANKDYAYSQSRVLIDTLKQFGVNAMLQNLLIGPSITKFEITLETGTRVNKLNSLSDDLKLALAVKDIRLEIPVPGKSAVGVEIPNESSTMVTFREVLQDVPSNLKDSKLVVPLGKNVEGNSIFTKLDTLPHLLIAGATGSGKSVCINTIICSILMRAKPDEVKLLLVDPKKVELACYDGIPHLLRPVVTDPKKAAVALRTIVEEMERRYEIFQSSNCRNITSYNEKANKDQLELLPYIVVILDEVADLMMVASKDVEDSIKRISQMARAAGIHLIIATQRPSTDVITGVIKSNIPSRIAFAVSSSIDSRTILDSSGAEKLLGKGDMLYLPMGQSLPIRIQGAFVHDDEVNRIVECVKSKQETHYEDKYLDLNPQQMSLFEEDEDEEYEAARDFVIRTQKASASLLQRQFRIGYNKAARLIDQLESNGVIGPQIGSKPREVYIQSYHEE